MPSTSAASDRGRWRTVRRVWRRVTTPCRRRVGTGGRRTSGSVEELSSSSGNREADLASRLRPVMWIVDVETRPASLLLLANIAFDQLLCHRALPRRQIQYITQQFSRRHHTPPPLNQFKYRAYVVRVQSVVLATRC